MNKYFNNIVVETNGVLSVSAGGALSISGGLSSTYVPSNWSNAKFIQPQGIAIDSKGNIYVSNSGGRSVYKLTSTGACLKQGLKWADGSQLQYNGQFDQPQGLALDSNGNLYVADSLNNQVRKITPEGVVIPLPDNNGPGVDSLGAYSIFSKPTGIAVDFAGNVYVTEPAVNVYRIRKITPAGVISTLAGTYNYPTGVAVDSIGNVYVADTSNNAIRKITPAGVVSTFAGIAGQFDYGTEDGTGAAARFYSPWGITIDSVDNLYVTDSSNFTIRKITPAGVTTTIAGLAGFSGSTDGTGTAARFYYPRGITIDSAGNLYVTDALNHTIRKITSAGVVTTIAGTVGVASSTEIPLTANTNTASISSVYYGDGSHLTETLQTVSTTLSNTFLDLSVASFFVIPITSNSTIRFMNAQSSGYFYFRTHTVGNGTAYTTTWPLSTKWIGGSAPTITSTSGKIDCFSFFTMDGGTSYYGKIEGQNY